MPRPAPLSSAHLERVYFIFTAPRRLGVAGRGRSAFSLAPLHAPVGWAELAVQRGRGIRARSVLLALLAPGAGWPPAPWAWTR